MTAWILAGLFAALVTVFTAGTCVGAVIDRRKRRQSDPHDMGGGTWEVPS